MNDKISEIKNENKAEGVSVPLTLKSKIAATVFRGNFSQVIKHVETKGQDVIITNRGRPIVKIIRYKNGE